MPFDASVVNGTKTPVSQQPPPVPLYGLRQLHVTARNRRLRRKPMPPATCCRGTVRSVSRTHQPAKRRGINPSSRWVVSAPTNTRLAFEQSDFPPLNACRAAHVVQPPIVAIAAAKGGQHLRLRFGRRLGQPLRFTASRVRDAHIELTREGLRHRHASGPRPAAASSRRPCR